jgi:hypothetical protein
MKSIDGGDNWTPAKNGLTAITVFSLVIDAVTPTTLYAGTYEQGVFRSTDGGGTWTPFNDGQPSPVVSSLVIDRTGKYLHAGTFGNGVLDYTITSNAFYTLVPCRVADTRNPDGLYGGPALAAGTDRGFVLAGQCGIPPTARAVAINVTVSQSTTEGDLRIYPRGTSLHLVSAINYRSAQTRANNAIAALGPAGDLSVHCDQASGSVHFILDVNGYFQ